MSDAQKSLPPVGVNTGSPTWMGPVGASTERDLRMMVKLGRVGTDFAPAASSLEALETDWL
jgi:hypothetical protein